MLLVDSSVGLCVRQGNPSSLFVLRDVSQMFEKSVFYLSLISLEDFLVGDQAALHGRGWGDVGPNLGNQITATILIFLCQNAVKFKFLDKMLIGDH